LVFERLVDAGGNQVGQTRAHSGPETLTYLLSSGGGGWRIAGGSRGDNAEVQL
jgi:hypothetical protein